MYNVTLLAACLLFATCSASAGTVEATIDDYVQKLRSSPTAMPPTLLNENPPRDDLLPILAKYKDDPSPRVRVIVSTHVSRYSTAKACELQIHFLDDEEAGVRGVAAAGLIRVFPADRLREHRQPIAAAVLRRLDDAQGVLPYLLLLVSGPQPDAVVKRLKDWRRETAGGRKIVPDAFIADVVLAEWGDRDALTRALRDCEGAANTKNAVVVAKVSSWLTQPAWLGVMESRINDRTIIKDHGSGIVIRACDYAVEALVRKARIKVPFEVDPVRAYTDDELKAAAAALSSK